MADAPARPDDLLSTFLATFPTLSYSQSESIYAPWVFWSQNEQPQNNSSSNDPEIPDRWVVHQKIRSAFSKARISFMDGLIQFWAPEKSHGRRLLTTSDQPFALTNLDMGLDKYRLCSLKYPYHIDVSNLEENPLIISGAPAASAFLNQMPELLSDLSVHNKSPLVSSALGCGLVCSALLPVFYPSQSCCVGVVECSTTCLSEDLYFMICDLNAALENEGLGTFHVRERLPYETVCGLESAKDEIDEALKIICRTHRVDLAQAWIAYEVENHVAYSSSLGDTQTKRVLGLKLSGHHVDSDDDDDDDDWEWLYSYVCDVCPLKMGEGLVGKTLQNHKPHFIKKNWMLSKNERGMLAILPDDCSYFVICLRSIETSDLYYAFEFFLFDSPNDVFFLEELLLTLKKCLPSFKYASGAEVGDELCILDVGNPAGSESRFCKIFQGSKSSPVPEALQTGRTPMVEKCSHIKAKCKTSPIPLSQKQIESEFGKTMKEAAKNLEVSVSTLKRKIKDLGISEWPGKKHSKRKVNDSYKDQSDTIEEDTGIIQDLSAINEETTVTIKAEFEDDVISFDLPMSSATFLAIQKEIAEELELNPTDYKIKYRDEDGEWILITSEKSMSRCIKIGEILVALQFGCVCYHAKYPIHLMPYHVI